MPQAPERVLKLALLGTSARPDTPEQIIQRRALVAHASTGDFPALLVQALTAILHPAHQNDLALRAINVRMGLTVGMEGFSRQTGAVITRMDSRPGLQVISVPTVILVGDCDAFTPLDRAEEIVAGIPNARLVV